MKCKGQKRMKRKEKEERTAKSLLDPLRDRWQHEKTCVDTSTAVKAILGLNLKVGVMNRRTGRDRDWRRLNCS